VAALLAAHGPALRRVARRWSLCEEDAEDAFQRSLEIYVRRLETVERATEAAWLKVVIRNEALAIRRARGESVGRDDVDLDARVAADLRALEDRLASRERSARSAEALRELKPDEALALLMKAEGHSYQEIAESQGWTYTKVNRSITEGRARFLKSFRAIEEGESCERLAPVLAALAAGSATTVQLREARPHLRHCAHCRAALRAMHVPLRRRVAALLPFGVVVEPLRQLVHRGPAEPPPSDLHPMAAPQIEGAAAKLPAALEHAERASRLPSPRPLFQALLHRITSSDLVTSAQLAASTGGGRTATVAALIGVCLSGVGAGTYCVATALLPDPPIVKAERPATKHDPPRHGRATTHRTTSAPATKPRTMAVATVTATASPARRTPKSSQNRTSKSSSTSSKSSAPEHEFGFESLGGGASSSSSQPAATTTSKPSKSSGGSRGGGSGGGGSATSGGEFLP
jgi:RNA polymerase sigma factor (sigma-70 family)